MSQFQIPHPRLTHTPPISPPRPLVHTCCSNVCKRECQLGCISITFKNKGSLWVCRSPDVCILPPRYAKVIRQKKKTKPGDASEGTHSPCSQKELHPAECFLIMLERTEKKRGTEPSRLFTAYQPEAVGHYLASCCAACHPDCVQGPRRRILASAGALYVFPLSFRPCSELFTRSPGTENDQL